MRSTLFRSEPKNPATSVVVVKDLDGVRPVTLSVECATHPSTTLNDEVPNAGLVFISKIIANGSAKSFVLTAPIRGQHVTVDTTGTQAVVTAVHAL